MPNTNVTCKNCENKFDASFEYCPHCGQKSNDKLTVGVLFRNTIKNYFSVDARFFKSFFPLLFKPGYLPTKFIEGKRLLYLHPAQLYLFSSIIFFFFFSFKVSKQEQQIRESVKSEKTLQQTIDSIKTYNTNDSLAAATVIDKLKKNQDKTGLKDEELAKLDSIIRGRNYNGDDFMTFGFNESKVDSLIAISAPDSLITKEMGQSKNAGYFNKKVYAQVLKLYKDNGSLASILHSFYDTIPIALFFLLPIFAFILKLLFYNKGPFAYHLVFGFYYFSYLFSTFIILMLVSFIWPSFSGYIQFLIVLSTFIYLCLAAIKFYKQGWFLSFIKCSLATFIYFVIVIPITIGILSTFAFLFY
ncbi:DUF3667 domain-containing protein [Cellulophaga sp. 20_2_10]|uniref:DUF3667 domain-containing protein n=1 Tax=Cellulophaga sp. 20_2_10 TaxID=2942476 RepID=UPI00201B1255|nr:DUF3667 domain-containing protein [Cellulophaga sp. 20_2_10]MCL5247127.1 DUF3667 domain-containing protein [Cellulophaga sp. 20_2_10]